MEILKREKKCVKWQTQKNESILLVFCAYLYASFLYEGDISRLGLIIPLAEMFNLILSRGTAFNRIVTHLCRTFIANKTVHSPFGVKFISIIKRRRLLQSYGIIEPNQRRGQHKQIVC